MVTDSHFPVSYLPADGVFESLRAYNGRIFRQEEHLERLFASAKTSGIEVPRSKKELADEIQRALRESGKKEAYVRLGLIRSRAEQKALIPGDGQLQIIVTETRTYPAACCHRGVKVITVVTRKAPVNALPPQVKSLDFLIGIMARIEAEDGFEALLLNPQGYLTEGTVSNVFLIKNSRLLSPPLYLGILPGITRGVVMELAAGLGIEVKEDILTRHEVYTADEVFLTNTSMELMPVRQVDGRAVGDGKPGILTRKLLEEFREETGR